MRVLDYRRRQRYVLRFLRAADFRRLVTYDPMVPEYRPPPEGKFDLVTCFETLEHLPDPIAGIADIAICVAEPGAAFDSTLTQPDDFDRQGMSWWYVGPRNGHISIFSKQALAMAWGRHGYRTARSTRHASGVSHAAGELGPGWQGCTALVGNRVGKAGGFDRPRSRDCANRRFQGIPPCPPRPQNCPPPSTASPGRTCRRNRPSRSRSPRRRSSPCCCSASAKARPACCRPR